MINECQANLFDFFYKSLMIFYIICQKNKENNQNAKNAFFAQTKLAMKNIFMLI